MRDQLSQQSWENMADMIPDNICHICLLLLKRYLVLFHFLEKYEVHLSNFQNMRYTFQFSKVLQNYPKFTAAMMKMVCRHENKFEHPSFCDQNLEHCVHMFHMLQKWYLSRSVFVFSSQLAKLIWSLCTAIRDFGKWEAFWGQRDSRAVLELEKTSQKIGPIAI